MQGTACAHRLHGIEVELIYYFTGWTSSRGVVITPRIRESLDLRIPPVPSSHPGVNPGANPWFR